LFIVKFLRLLYVLRPVFLNCQNVSVRANLLFSTGFKKNETFNFADLGAGGVDKVSNITPETVVLSGETG